MYKETLYEKVGIETHHSDNKRRILIQRTILEADLKLIAKEIGLIMKLDKENGT